VLIHQAWGREVRRHDDSKQGTSVPCRQNCYAEGTDLGAGVMQGFCSGGGGVSSSR
jgi:hypothetical protein